MKFIYDKQKIKESLAHYDSNGLTSSESGRYRYPSKMMFIKFLEPYMKKEFKQLKGTVDIWSERDYAHGVERIHVDIVYEPRAARKEKAK